MRARDILEAVVVEDHYDSMRLRIAIRYEMKRNGGDYERAKETVLANTSSNPAYYDHILGQHPARNGQ